LTKRGILEVKGGEKMDEVMKAIKNGEGELALAIVVLLGLTPEEVDKLIKLSRETLESEEEKEED
jgi:hypothetical protein